MIAVSAAIAHLKHKASKEPADRHPRSIARSFSSAAIPGRRGALFELIQLAGTILNISGNTKDPIHLYLELLELYLSVMNHLSAIVALSRSREAGSVVWSVLPRALFYACESALFIMSSITTTNRYPDSG